MDLRSTHERLERMELEYTTDERRSEHGEERGEVLVQNVLERELVVLVGFLHECEIPAPGQSLQRRSVPVPLVASLALEALNLLLELGAVGAECELLAVTKVDLVIGLALADLHALVLHRCAKVRKALVKEAGQQKQRGTLIEAVALAVADDRAPSAGEVVALEHSLRRSAPICQREATHDVEAGVREAGRGGRAAHARADHDRSLLSLGGHGRVRKR